MSVEKKTEALFESFLELEKRAGFFDIEIDDVPVWERIRHSVYRDIKQSLEIEGQAHATSNAESASRKYLHALKALAVSGVSRNPLFSGKHDIFIYGHQRRKQLDDGRWWDIYFDPIYEEIDLDYVHLENQYQNEHLTPARTENLRYREFIYYLAHLWRMVGLGLPALTERDLEQARYIETEITAEFGVELNFEDRIRRQLELREPLRRLYRTMLKRIDPEIVLLVVGYGRDTFVETCQEMGIPVVELQHGVIHDRKLEYTYSDKELFPDYLFVWGEFWKERIEFPIPDDHVVPVGYPYLEQAAGRYADVPSQEQLLFISQGPFGEQLSRLAVEVDQHPAIEHNIVYKLHPGEYDRWQDEYPWLLDADFRIIDSPSPPLYQLFAESSAQIGVGSTAVYEGLCFDLETYVYNYPGSHILEPLVNEGAATTVSNVNGLASELGTQAVSFEQESYFLPNAIANISRELTAIQKRAGDTPRRISKQ